MRLIVTLGTTKANYNHKYFIENQEYNEKFSFLALQKHFNIKDEDVIIIGTAQTQEVQNEYIENYNNFIPVDADKLEDVFAKINETIKSGDILDLTQSFKSVSFGAILAYSFSKTLGKRVKNIYYAQVQNNCNAFSSECEFIFQSLKKYEDIIDLVREINLFTESWQVINRHKEEEFKVIHNNLQEVSKRLFVNDLDIKDYLILIEKEITRIKKIDEYSYLWEHLDKLYKEIKKLKDSLVENEYLRLIKFSRLYFDKNLLLQSLTVMFEAIGAYLEYKTDNNFKCKNSRGTFTKKDDKYKFRNCLKSKVSVVRYGKNIPRYIFKFIKVNRLEEFAKHYVKVDELRNNSAHVFINGKDEENFKKAIEKELKYFEDILK